MDDITKDPNRRNAYGQYTHYPFANPQNRHQARENAKWYVSEGMYDASLAWAAIAETFPPDPEPDPPFQADDRGPGFTPQWEEPDHDRRIALADDTTVLTMPGAGSTMVVRPSEMSPAASEYGATTPGRVEVDAVAWDVLRALAARYVLSSMDKHATVDLSENEVNRWELKMTRMPDSGVVQVFVESPRS